MLVKDLVKELTEMGLEKELRFSCTIESGRSWTGCNKGNHSLYPGVKLTESEDGSLVTDLDENGNEIPEEDVVVLRVDGNEDWYE